MNSPERSSGYNNKINYNPEGVEYKHNGHKMNNARHSSSQTNCHLSLIVIQPLWG